MGTCSHIKSQCLRGSSRFFRFERTQMWSKSQLKRSISRVVTIVVVVVVIIIIAVGGLLAYTSMNSKTSSTTSSSSTSSITTSPTTTTTTSNTGGASTSSTGSGTLVIGMTVSPATNDLSPVKMLSTYYMAETYASLVGWDSKGTTIPMLAQDWTISSDGLTMTFHLKPNLQWSDGQPLTSADVAFTYRLIAEDAPLWYFLTIPLQQANSSTVTGFSLVPGAVTTPDSTTVVIHSSTPAATLFMNIAGQPIYPQHYYASQNLTANNPNLATMVGSGPFIPKSYSPGSGPGHGCKSSLLCRSA